MLRRLELSGHAMMLRMTQLEVVSNNLANVDTTGYKRDNVFFSSLRDRITQSDGGPEPEYPSASVRIDLGQGSLAETNRPLDLAISGAGFFVVETPQGEAYTRDGKFSLNSDNILVNLDGYAVLGQGGPVEINIEQNQPNEVLINEAGEIFVDGNIVDRLLVLLPADPQALVKQGANLFRLRQDVGQLREAEAAAVKQGFLEDSNVDVVIEMVELMEIVQHFEMGQKMVRAQDDILDRAASQIGRVA